MESCLHRGVASLQRILESHPDSEWASTQLIQAQQELREVEDRSSEYVYQRQATQWTQVGNRVTGEFFVATRPRHSWNGIRQLRRLDGSMTSERDEMREMATRFYHTLLTKEIPPDTWWKSRQGGFETCTQDCDG